jgi:acetyl-CoA acetyltransferase
VSPAPVEEPLERRAIISGIGQSQIGRRLGRSDLDLTVEAALAAIADAGLERDDVDGLSTYPGMGSGTPGFAGPTSPEVQDALGLSLNWHDGGGEGAAQMRAVITASLAVAAGLARHVLVYRTVTEGTAQGAGGRQSVAWAAADAACRASAVSCSGHSLSAPCRRSTGSPWSGSAACTSSG